MTRGITAVFAAGAVLMLSAGVAHAGPIRYREGNQAARIHQGVRSGSLTPGEAHALRREQRSINHARRHVLADGHVTVREAVALDRAQDRANRHIYRLKHNGRVAN